MDKFIMVNKICHDSTVEARVLNVSEIHHIRPAHSVKWGDHCGIYFADNKTWWNVKEDFDNISDKLLSESNV